MTAVLEARVEAPVHTGLPAPKGLRRPSWEALLKAALVLVAATVQSVGVFGFPALADDEGTYSAQAWAVQHGELAHYTYWYDHPPLGWIQLGALDWLPRLLFPGVQPVAADRLVIVLANLVSALLLYTLARRLDVGPVAASAAVLLFAVSPLTVTLGRQVYLDSLATLWVLAALVLVVNRRSHLWQHVAAGACFAAAVLTKETTLVLVVAVGWALLQHAHPRTRAFSVVGFLGGFGLAGMFYPLMALLRGELVPGPGHVSLLGGAVFQLASRPGSGAVWDSASDARTVVDGWLFFDPWLVVLGLVGLPLALASRRLRPVGVALTTVVLVGLRPGGYLPAMYVIGALPFLALCAAGAADLVWQWTSAHGAAVRRAGQALLVAATVLLVVAMTPKWYGGLTGAMATDTSGPRRAAEDWIAANTGPQSTVLVDDVSWVGLVAGQHLPRSRVVWFYKLDTDPAVQAEFPQGWRDVDYVLATGELRAAIGSDPSLRQGAAALAESRVAATFGSGDAAVTVLEVRNR